MTGRSRVLSATRDQVVIRVASPVKENSEDIAQKANKSHDKDGKPNTAWGLQESNNLHTSTHVSQRLRPPKTAEPRATPQDTPQVSPRTGHGALLGFGFLVVGASILGLDPLSTTSNESFAEGVGGQSSGKDDEAADVTFSTRQVSLRIMGQSRSARFRAIDCFLDGCKPATVDSLHL